LAEDQHSRFRQNAPNFAGRVEAIQVRHADVHDDDIRFQLFGFFDSVPAVNRFATNFPSASALQQNTNALTDIFMVIRDEDPHEVRSNV